MSRSRRWLAIEATGARNVERLASLSLKLAAALSLAVLVASPAIAVARAWTSHDQNDVEPRQELAVAADLFWRETTGKPLAYVSNSRFYDDGVVFLQSPTVRTASSASTHSAISGSRRRSSPRAACWRSASRTTLGCLAAAAPFRTAASRTRRDHARAHGFRPHGQAGRVRPHGVSRRANGQKADGWRPPSTAGFDPSRPSANGRNDWTWP